MYPSNFFFTHRLLDIYTLYTLQMSKFDTFKPFLKELSDDSVLKDAIFITANVRIYCKFFIMLIIKN